ncbi:fimbrial adhesin EcpD [Kosakonia radicincitans]|uniref:fimbrial adhesin EcpD n=1 Tax=Kosakonia radicincitans TaxID=283686 RepID=UPI0031E48259
MKVNLSRLLFLIIFYAIASPANAAVTKISYADAPTRNFIFVENDTDDNYFVTPAGVRDPRMTGSNRWTGLKYNGSGSMYQTSLGYIDNGYNTIIGDEYQFDMWLTNAPASNLLVGMRCINWYSGCDMATSLLPATYTDSQGFYGVDVTSGGTKWAHGMMSDQFYHYLNNFPVGQIFSMTINTCRTEDSYDPRMGQRCRDMPSGTWYERTVSHTKAAHFKFFSTNSISEIFFNTDGTPTIGEGNADCRMQVIGSVSGIACKVVTYTLNHNGISDTDVRFFPAISHAGLESAIRAADMQFSLDGASWQTVSGITHYYTFNAMKGHNSIYVFFSNNFFKEMINQGVNGGNLRDLVTFRLRNLTAPESGWYEFSTSAQLIFKPTNFSISIIPADFIANPSRSGTVGSGNPDLDFDYLVTTNGKTAADMVLVSVSGPTQTINGRPWCIFSSKDGKTQVPFPGIVSFATSSGNREVVDVGCDGQWRDMTNALWASIPLALANGETGVTRKSTVRFSIPMNDPQSLKTLNNASWYGDVSASGKVTVMAMWQNAR